MIKKIIYFYINMPCLDYNFFFFIFIQILTYFIKIMKLLLIKLIYECLFLKIRNYELDFLNSY